MNWILSLFNDVTVRWLPERAASAAILRVLLTSLGLGIERANPHGSVFYFHAGRLVPDASPLLPLVRSSPTWTLTLQNEGAISGSLSHHHVLSGSKSHHGDRSLFKSPPSLSPSVHFTSLLNPDQYPLSSFVLSLQSSLPQHLPCELFSP